MLTLLKWLVVSFVIGMLYNLYKFKFLVGRGKRTRPSQIAYPQDLIATYDQAYDFETGFHRGSGGKVDIAKALELYKSAAAREYPPAYYRLAYIYCYGKNGQYKDLSKARFYCVKALEREYQGADELYHHISQLEKIAQAKKDANRIKDNPYIND